MTQRTLGILAGALTGVFLITWIAAGFASVAAGFGPREAMKLAIDVKAMIDMEGLEAVQNASPRPSGTMSTTRFVVTDTDGVIVASWPDELIGKRLQFQSSSWPRFIGDSGRIGIEMGPEGVPMPYLHQFQEGRLIWSETGKLLFGDEAQGRRARGSVSRLPTLAPDGQAYYVFATATLWQFAGLTATDWNETPGTGGVGHVLFVGHRARMVGSSRCSCL